jgi:hypothetical protein
MANVHQVWKVTYRVLGVDRRDVHLSTTAKTLTPELLAECLDAIRHDLAAFTTSPVTFRVTGVEWIAESVEINGQTSGNAR